jgi:MFS family permease
MSSEPLFTRRFFGLWAFAFVTFFSAFQLLPAIPFRIMQLGGSKATAGWFLTVYTFASAFAAPVMGTIADHVGRKRLLIVASALFIVFSLLYGFVVSIPLLLLIGVVHGSLWSALLSSASAIMSEYIPTSRRTEGLAYWGLAGNAAIAVAPLAGLLILEYGWLYLCLELAGLSVIMLIWSSKLPIATTARPPGLPSLHDAWDWSVIRLALSMAVIAFGYGGVTSFVAILSIERNIQPKSLFFTVLAITVVAIRIFTSRLGDIYGPKALLYPSYAAVPLSFFILAAAETRGELILSAALLGAGFGGAWPAFTSYVLSHTDPERRARTFGSIVWAFDIGIGSGSLALGLLGEHYSLRVSFIAAGILSLLAIPIFVIASRSMRSLANAP